MAILCVYVSQKSKNNLEIGIEQGIWGWKDPAIEMAKTEPGWPGIGVGDYLMLGHLWVEREEKDLADFTVGRVVVGRVVKGLYTDATEVWSDDAYPNRVRFSVIDIFDAVSGPDIGQGAMEALRRSRIIRGAPFQDVSGLAIGRLAGTADVLGASVPDIEPHDSTDSMSDLPDDLDYPARVMLRREQWKLRKEKFHGAADLTCALCGRFLPARFVHTAHVKKRSAASYSERCDLSNIMGACVLGCDALFEYGFVYVADDGVIRAALPADIPPDLHKAAAELDGRFCNELGKKSAHYFAWQRMNVAGVNE